MAFDVLAYNRLLNSGQTALAYNMLLNDPTARASLIANQNNQQHNQQQSSGGGMEEEIWIHT